MEAINTRQLGQSRKEVRKHTERKKHRPFTPLNCSCLGHRVRHPQDRRGQQQPGSCDTVSDGSEWCGDVRKFLFDS